VWAASQNSKIPVEKCRIASFKVTIFRTLLTGMSHFSIIGQSSPDQLRKTHFRIFDIAFAKRIFRLKGATDKRSLPQACHEWLACVFKRVNKNAAKGKYCLHYGPGLQ
jgi:hypothetical protein